MFRTIFDKVQSCLIKNLNSNIVPRIFTSHLGFEVEVGVGVWSWRLKMKLALEVEVGVGVGVWSWSWRLRLKFAVWSWSWLWRLKLKLAFEVGVALLSCGPYYGWLSIWTFHLILFAKIPTPRQLQITTSSNQLKFQFKYASKCSELSFIKFSPVF